MIDMSTKSFIIDKEFMGNNGRLYCSSDDGCLSRSSRREGVAENNILPADFW